VQVRRVVGEVDDQRFSEALVAVGVMRGAEEEGSPRVMADGLPTALVMTIQEAATKNVSVNVSNVTQLTLTITNRGSEPTRLFANFSS
jgi:hypothetical protein